MVSRLWFGRLALGGVAGLVVVGAAFGCGSSSDGDEGPLNVDYDSGITGGLYNVVYTQAQQGTSYQSSGYAVAVYGTPDESTELSHQCQADGYATQKTTKGSNAACTIVVCTDPVPEADDDGGTTAPTDQKQPTSGTVTLTTALVPAGVVMTPDDQGTCTTGSDPIAAQWWAAGDDTIAVHSTGSAVPAISRTDLIGPPALSSITFNGTELTSGGSDAGADDGGDPDPEQSFTGPTVTMSRGQPLAVTYAGGIAGTSVHLVLTTSSVDQETTVDCRFDATQGSQTIPAADLASLQVTDDGDVLGQYYVDSLSESSAVQSSWSIQTRLVSLGPDALLVVTGP